MRERDQHNVRSCVAAATEGLGFDEVSLASLSTADHSEIAELIGGLGDELTDKRVSMSVPSLRAYGLEEGVVEAHGRGQTAEQLRVRHRLAQRLDRPVVEGQVEMSPGEHDVELLQLGRRRQDNIRVKRGVGEKMLADHREQVRIFQES